LLYVRNRTLRVGIEGWPDVNRFLLVLKVALDRSAHGKLAEFMVTVSRSIPVCTRLEKIMGIYNQNNQQRPIQQGQGQGQGQGQEGQGGQGQGQGGRDRDGQGGGDPGRQGGQDGQDNTGGNGGQGQGGGQGR
jgi:hypothetical protein